MKKIILIILLFGVSQAQVNKKKLRNNLHDCENALSACLSAQNITSDTIYIYTAKEAVKVAKQVEKTKRKVKVQETKQNKIQQQNRCENGLVFKLDARNDENDCYTNCWWLCGWWSSNYEVATSSQNKNKLAILATYLMCIKKEKTKV
jgi:hypothetical protein